MKKTLEEIRDELARSEGVIRDTYCDSSLTAHVAFIKGFDASTKLHSEEIKRLEGILAKHKLYEDYEHEIERLKRAVEIQAEGLRRCQSAGSPARLWAYKAQCEADAILGDTDETT